MRRRFVWLTSLLTLALLSVGLPAANAAAGRDPAHHAPPSHHPHSYSLLQMNLCLSGIAGCYPGTDYPAVVNEAIGKIRRQRPDAVTIVETCSGDARHIARATGYHLAFGTVIYKGEQLPCVKPDTRGVYGITLLTRRPMVAVNDRPYRAQNGNEERRRVCATTIDGATACVTHLAVRDADPDGADSVANDGQCAEFGRLLARYARFGGPVIAAGDINRQTSCAPHGFWTRRDTASDKTTGLQHVYGTHARLHHPTDQVLPMAYSDHNALLVKAGLAWF